MPLQSREPRQRLDDIDIDRQNKTLSTFAVIRNGEWYERGAMGWWGIVTDEKDCEEWDRKWWDMFEALPDDTRLSVVDCHI